MDPPPSGVTSPPQPSPMPNGTSANMDTKITEQGQINRDPVYPARTVPSISEPPPHDHSTPTNTFTDDVNTHGLDLPWVTRDLSNSTTITVPSSPTMHGLTHRVSELNLSAHPSRLAYPRKHQTRTACFVHSLLQNGRGRSPSRRGSSDDLTRGSMLEVINKGPERRDRWNRGMTKKELSDMALGVRELSKRLGELRFVLRLMVGGARMKLRVRTIIIITKKHDRTLVGLTRQVTDWLLHHSEGKKEPYTVYEL